MPWVPATELGGMRGAVEVSGGERWTRRLCPSVHAEFCSMGQCDSLFQEKKSLDYVSKHTKSLKIPTGFWHLYGKKPVEVV